MIKEEKKVPRLDPTKPIVVVYGDPKIKYEQGNLQFNHKGDFVRKKRSTK